MITSKILEEEKVSREDRRKVATLLRLYLNGELDTMIEFQGLKAESEPAVGAVDYSRLPGGNGGKKSTVIERFEAERRSALLRRDRLMRVKKFLEIGLRLLSEESDMILNLYYREKYSIQYIAARLGYAEITVKTKKREALDELAKRIGVNFCTMI